MTKVHVSDLRWSRSSHGWRLRLAKGITPTSGPTIYGGSALHGRVVGKRRFVWPERRKITIAECHAASREEAIYNPIHADLAQHYSIGNRYCPWNPDDKRYFIDAVWVPEFCETPASIRSYISKGCCSSSPGDPGTWWLHFDAPRSATIATQGAQIGLFA